MSIGMTSGWSLVLICSGVSSVQKFVIDTLLCLSLACFCTKFYVEIETIYRHFTWYIFALFFHVSHVRANICEISLVAIFDSRPEFQFLHMQTISSRSRIHTFRRCLRNHFRPRSSCILHLLGIATPPIGFKTSYNYSVLHQYALARSIMSWQPVCWRHPWTS